MSVKTLYEDSALLYDLLGVRPPNLHILGAAEIGETALATEIAKILKRPLKTREIDKDGRSVGNTFAVHGHKDALRFGRHWDFHTLRPGSGNWGVCAKAQAAFENGFKRVVLPIANRMEVENEMNAR